MVVTFLKSQLRLSGLPPPGPAPEKSTVQQHVERSFGLQLKKKKSQLFISIFALRLNPMRKVSTVSQ